MIPQWKRGGAPWEARVGSPRCAVTFNSTCVGRGYTELCKLLRKGYAPLEIPVNYQARSFKEGKKVAIFRDPPTWVKAMVKYRFNQAISPRDPGAGGKSGAAP